ncbi:MAG: DNA-binding protein, partial [Oscillospiraceae bacterium]|nr:DNA-binding protein [Oscillospiraceae bacterium]
LFRVRLNGTEFSFSGLENQVRDHYARTQDPAATAGFALRSIAYAVRRATLAAEQTSPYPVVFSGGVASNSLLRRSLSDLDCVFAEPACSTDNALGVAVLTYLREA